MLHCISVALLFLGLCGSFIARAEPGDFVQLAEQKKLSESAAWLKILHFQGSESFVDDARYFLAPTGKTDPAAELAATIESLLAGGDVFCQFPFRRQWLAEQLPGFAEALPVQICQDYQQWREHISAHSVTLVLAASYLNSPSSMYGHTFLRFDRKDSESDLNAYAVSFGALVTDGGGLLFAYNGIFGGYPGRFNDSPYHEKIKEYSRLDNRDLWEYKLNLSPDETDRLVAHLWELNDINFDYYFIDENCSFRLLELIEVARPSLDLSSQFSLSAIPIDTIRVVADAEAVAAIKYRPSNQKKLQHKIQQLADDDQLLAWRLAEQELRWQDLSFDASDGQRAYQVAELAYHYLRYKNNRKARRQQDADVSFELLRAMNQWAAFRVDSQPEQPIRPEQGHESRSLTGYLGYHELYRREFFELEWKASYHDLLDNPAGYPESISLNLGQAKLRVYDNAKLDLRELNILEVSSLSPSSRFFNGNSWRSRAGFERLSFQPSKSQIAASDKSPEPGDTPIWFAEGAYGKTYPLLGLNAYILLNGRVEFNRKMQQEAALGLGVQAGVFMQSDSGSWFAESRFYQFIADDQRVEGALGWHLPLSRNNGLRVQAKYYDFDEQYRDYTEAQLAWRWHYR